MTLYTAMLECQTKEQRREGVASGRELLFEDDSPDAALRSVFRWWHNRNKVFSDIFCRLCAVKVYETVPQRMQPDGYLPQNHGLRCKEWKYDQPFAARDYSEATEDMEGEADA